MKASKPATGVATYWHPNFRVVDTLPDTKVVRTSFVVNAAAFVFMAGVAFFLVRREMAVAEVKNQIAAFDASIAENTPRYKQAVQLQQEFAANEKKLKEVQAFWAPTLVASDFLEVIADTLPRLITIDSIEMNGDSIRLRGTVVGSSERSAPLAKAYADQLAENPILVAQMEGIKLNSQSRDQAGDRFTFEIELTLKAKK